MPTTISVCKSVGHG